MLRASKALDKKTNEKGFELAKKVVISRLKWFASIGLISFLIQRWLPILTLPATLFVWTFRDQKINKHYLDFKSGEMRNYEKCSNTELTAFLEGVEASQSYFNQFKANIPGSNAWKNSKSYYAGLGAGVEGDEELIEMVKHNKGLKQ